MLLADTNRPRRIAGDSCMLLVQQLSCCRGTRLRELRARTQLLSFPLIFPYSTTVSLLTLPSYSMGKNGVRSDVSVGRYAGAIRIASLSRARRPPCTDSSSMPSDLSVHPLRRCCIFDCLLENLLSAHQQAVQNTTLCIHRGRHDGARACTCDV